MAGVRRSAPRFSRKVVPFVDANAESKIFFLRIMRCGHGNFVVAARITVHIPQVTTRHGCVVDNGGKRKGVIYPGRWGQCDIRISLPVISRGRFVILLKRIR